MPPATLRLNILIHAPVQTVFDYVADLTRHGEWSSDPVQIHAISDGGPGQGKRYASKAESHGTVFETELEITEFERLSRLVFEGADATGKFRHVFTFEPTGNGTLVRREMRFDATPAQWLLFYLALYPVRIPSGKRTLERLRERLEAETQAGLV